MQTDLFGVYVRARLDRWGEEFALHRDCEYLGHQSRNMICTLMEHEGEMPPPNIGYKPLEVDLLALEIEEIVTDIAREGGVAMACCLRGYFCGRGRRQVERYEQALELMRKAKLHAMPSVRGYRTQVEMGEIYVRGVLRERAQPA